MNVQRFKFLRSPVLSRIGTIFSVSLVGLLVIGCGGAPTRVHAYNDYAIRAAQHDLWKEASLRWEQALALDKTDSRIWNNLGVAYESDGRFEDALKSYREAVKLDVGNSQYVRNLRRAEANRERAKAAKEKAAQEVIDESQNDTDDSSDNSIDLDKADDANDDANDE
ncbi:MAG: tetratricopeptide repeat protein [Candidatus Poribacteria bacterium]|nr:tetratricopeptide repeat protein [Candidatus Poribacteria bacterium]